MPLEEHASTQDPLLAELQGVAVMTRPDETPETEKDPLVRPLGPKEAGPITKKMDAKHSIAAGGKGYAVTIEGEYFARSKEHAGASIRLPYEHTFNLAAAESALSTIVRTMLEPALKKKDPNYIRYRTHEIKDVRLLSPETPASSDVMYMTRGQLEVLVKDDRIPVDIKAYPEVSHLREAVIDFLLNQKGFEAREAKKQAERAELVELAKLNPDLSL